MRWTTARHQNTGVTGSTWIECPRERGARSRNETSYGRDVWWGAIGKSPATLTRAGYWRGARGSHLELRAGVDARTGRCPAEHNLAALAPPAHGGRSPPTWSIGGRRLPPELGQPRAPRAGAG